MKCEARSEVHFTSASKHRVKNFRFASDPHVEIENVPAFIVDDKDNDIFRELSLD